MIFTKFHLFILCITGYLAMAGGALLAPAFPEMIVPLQTNDKSSLFQDLSPFLPMKISDKISQNFNGQYMTYIR